LRVSAFVYCSARCWLVVCDQAPVVITLVVLGGLYGAAFAGVCTFVVSPRMIAGSVGRSVRPPAIRPPRFPRPPRRPIITRFHRYYGVPRTPGQPRFHHWVWLCHSVLQILPTTVVGSGQFWAWPERWLDGVEAWLRGHVTALDQSQRERQNCTNPTTDHIVVHVLQTVCCACVRTMTVNKW